MHAGMPQATWQPDHAPAEAVLPMSGLRDTGRRPEGAFRSSPKTDETAVDLYWLPLGAGGHCVRLNGIAYEAICATIRRRPRCDLYHSALEIAIPGRLFPVEMTPTPNGRDRGRGVVADGPVETRSAGRFRMFRYEVRRWPNGAIPDLPFAVASPIRVSDDPAVAERSPGRHGRTTR
jgi:hypothetical protein